jgi:hypothetical protein
MRRDQEIWRNLFKDAAVWTHIKSKSSKPFRVVGPSESNKVVILSVAAARNRQQKNSLAATEGSEASAATRSGFAPSSPYSILSYAVAEPVQSTNPPNRADTSLCDERRRSSSGRANCVIKIEIPESWSLAITPRAR